MPNAASETTRQALSIISSPSIHHSQPLRLIAWAILKAERGQTICQTRLKPVRTAQLDRVA